MPMLPSAIYNVFSREKLVANKYYSKTDAYMIFKNLHVPLKYNRLP